MAVGAVEVRTRRQPAAEGKKHKRMVYAGRLRLRLVPDRGAKELTEFVQEDVAMEFRIADSFISAPADLTSDEQKAVETHPAIKRGLP
jgi:hypothetical protein